MTTVPTINYDVHKAVETMTSLQISEITGKRHDNVMRDIRKLLEQGVSQLNFELSSYQQQQPKGGVKEVACYNLTKKGCLILASGYNAVLREKIIDRWEDLEAKNNQLNFEPVNHNPRLQEAEAQLYLIEQISRNLRLNDTGRLGMYQSLAEQHNLQIPAYVQSKGVHRAAKDLLSEIGSDMSSRKFNLLLEEHGYIEKKTRPSSKGGSKTFWSITLKGEPYGENCVSPNNPNETQPHWYEDRFRSLYEIVTNK